MSAAWLLALILPLVMFYFLKLRRPAVKVPSLVLWRQVLNDNRVNAPFQKFKRNILLLLQLLLLIMLIIAAMQPYWRGTADKMSRWPVLVDVSASMAATDSDGQSRLDEAKEELREMIDGLRSDQQMCIISFANSARKLTDFTNNKRVLLAAVDALEVEDVPSALEDALRLAQAMSRSHPFQRVMLMTDGNVPSSVNFDLPFSIDVQQLEPAAPNAGIVALGAQRGGRGTWDVYGSILNASSSPIMGFVELWQDGQQVAREPLTVEAEREERLVFSVQSEKQSQVELRWLPDRRDSLASDDRAYLQLERARQLRVFVPSHMVAPRLAMGAISDVDLYPMTNGETDQTVFDLVITDRKEDLGMHAGVWLTIGMIPDQLNEMLAITSEEGTSAVDWQRLSPVLEHVELGDLVIIDSPVNKPDIEEKDYEAAGYEILAHGEHGPLLLQKQEGQQIYLHLLFHTDRSTLPYRVGFPIFLNNVVNIAMRQSGLSDASGVRTGVLPALSNNLSSLQTCTIISPAGMTREETTDQHGVLRGVPAPKSGIYEIVQGDTQLNIGASLLDARETSLGAAEEISFREVTVSAAGGGVRTDRSLWRRFAILALILLLVEWWFFNRRPTGAR